MKKIEMNFAQLFCLIICMMCIIVITIIFFFIALHPSIFSIAATAGVLTMIIAAIIGAFVKCYTFIVGSTASSQAKDQYIANSTPIAAINTVSASVTEQLPAQQEIKKN